MSIIFLNVYCIIYIKNLYVYQPSKVKYLKKSTLSIVFANYILPMLILKKMF